jgi:hypothetical protein
MEMNRIASTQTQAPLLGRWMPPLGLALGRMVIDRLLTQKRVLVWATVIVLLLLLAVLVVTPGDRGARRLLVQIFTQNLQIAWLFYAQLAVNTYCGPLTGAAPQVGAQLRISLNRAGAVVGLAGALAFASLGVGLGVGFALMSLTLVSPIMGAWKGRGYLVLTGTPFAVYLADVFVAGLPERLAHPGLQASLGLTGLLLWLAVMGQVFPRSGPRPAFAELPSVEPMEKVAERARNARHVKSNRLYEYAFAKERAARAPGLLIHVLGAVGHWSRSVPVYVLGTVLLSVGGLVWTHYQDGALAFIVFVCVGLILVHGWVVRDLAWPLQRTRGEQGLLALTPGVPRGKRQARVLVMELSRRWLGQWLCMAVAMLVALTILRPPKSAVFLILLVLTASLYGMLSFVRDYSREDVSTIGKRLLNVLWCDLAPWLLLLATWKLHPSGTPAFVFHIMLNLLALPLLYALRWKLARMDRAPAPFPIARFN